MLRVLLVDDEEIIRDGIKNGIDWESHGIEVAGTAEDGEQAVEAVHLLKPDIIITDIKMPFIDGLEFIEKIKPDFPDVFIIIISGHDEFIYAKRALQLGAYDYILKPIELDYLNEILIKIKTEFAKKEQDEKEICVLREQVEENAGLVRENFLKEIVNKRMETDYIKQKFEDLNIDFAGQCFGVISVQIDDYYNITQNLGENEAFELEAEFCNTVRDALANERSFLSFSNRRGECVIIAAERHTEILKRKTVDIYNRIREEIRSRNKTYTCTAGTGSSYNSMEMLPVSYKEAIDTINYKFIIGKDRIIFFDNVRSYEKNEYYSIDYNDMELISLIRTGDKKLIEDKLHALMDDIKAKGSNSYLYMQIVISSIYMQAIKVLKDIGGSVEEVFTNPIEAYNRIMAHQTVESLMSELTTVLFSIADYVSARKSGRFNLVIERAKEYIKKNYSRDNFSLDDVANFVNMSTCYFSVIFKQEVGETFIDYLTGLRIEKAKELLLLPGYKTYEISYMIGYNNPTYFSTTFKKITGCSPSDYRDRFSNV